MENMRLYWSNLKILTKPYSFFLITTTSTAAAVMFFAIILLVIVVPRRLRSAFGLLDGLIYFGSALHQVLKEAGFLGLYFSLLDLHRFLLLELLGRGHNLMPPLDLSLITFALDSILLLDALALLF